MSDDKVYTMHVQTVVLTFACEDAAIDRLDALNSRIKTFILEDIVKENDIDGRYDGVTLAAESSHDDVVGTAEDFQEMAGLLGDDDSLVTEQGIRLPKQPTKGKELLN